MNIGANTSTSINRYTGIDNSSASNIDTDAVQTTDPIESNTLHVDGEAELINAYSKGLINENTELSPLCNDVKSTTKLR